YSAFHLKNEYTGQMFPISVQNLSNFIADLSLKNYAGSSIATIVSGLSFLHKILNKTDPANSFMVRKLIRGALAINPPQQTRMAITINTLSEMLRVLPSVTECKYDQDLFSALFSLSFHALLRVGEVTGAPGKNPNVITSENVKLGKTSISLTLHNFKHKKTTKPITLEIQSSNQKDVCPVHTLECYLSQRGTSNGPLFRNEDHSEITRSRVHKVMSESLEAAGFDSSSYNTHSFRIGGMNNAISNNVDLDTIQRWGRWSSQAAMNKYIRI
ncbi:unnamed protein product, partial [Owenia fusiformis]